MAPPDTSLMGKMRLGRLGERLVAARLEARGYLIVDANVRLGPLEIDLVARRGRTLVICEVRTRRAGTAVDPIFTFSAAKQRHVRLAAARYVAERRPAYDELRLDAAAVLIDRHRRVACIRYVEAAF